MKRFFALLNARNKEFLRDRGSLAWSLLFPFLVVLGFSFAFSGQNQDVFKVALYRAEIQNPASQAASGRLLETRYIQFVPTDDLEPALAKLRRHQYDMVVSVENSLKYWLNSSSPKGYLLEKIITSGTSGQTVTFERAEVSGREIRYVDWLIAGLLSMNVMFGSLFGVGYVIVRYRKAGILRRIKATPVTAFEFLSAQVVSRLFLMMIMCTIVLIGCSLLVDLNVVGHYFDLFFVLMTGALCMISLALLIAARISSEEFAGGLLNVLTWPMMLFSGVWFSLEGTNPLLRKFSQLIPLTHMVDASRAVINEGATLAGVSHHLVPLIALTLVFMVISAWMFRWE